jgi:hypothetical protein
MQISNVCGVTKMMGSRQAVLWLALNLLDLGLSIVSLEYGARELPMLGWLLVKIPMTSQYVTISYVWYGAYKIGLAALVLTILVLIGKSSLLKWLNIGLAGVGLYIVVMLIITFS